LTPVPGTQPWLLGVANIRGNLVPVVDLGLFLFGSATLIGERTRVLLVRQGNSGSVGLLVDEVSGQRSLTLEMQSDAEGEDDPRLQRFVERNVRIEAQRLGVFSMLRLTRAADFQQAAA
ncbi:MAG: chemotaxis protein CheW, partial [Metallibacterium sp.]